jgi:hypothetical protein
VEKQEKLFCVPLPNQMAGRGKSFTSFGLSNKNLSIIMKKLLTLIVLACAVVYFSPAASARTVSVQGKHKHHRHHNSAHKSAHTHAHRLHHHAQA